MRVSRDFGFPLLILLDVAIVNTEPPWTLLPDVIYSGHIKQLETVGVWAELNACPLTSHKPKETEREGQPH
jgi:hypothetical protein